TAAAEYQHRFIVLKINRKKHRNETARKYYLNCNTRRIALGKPKISNDFMFAKVMRKNGRWNI
ncbi:MAG: hypothetical protein OSJ61_20075, partial [Lachnospiraceae bacterium]|nr:hypothetical protein [Lachnospiraceae bacterium]